MHFEIMANSGNQVKKRYDYKLSLRLLDVRPVFLTSAVFVIAQTL
jgi:hypothetical protein